MRRHVPGIPLLAFVLVACSGTATPAPTASPTPIPTPTATPTPAPTLAPAASPAGSGSPFSGLPYTVTLPPGWVAFDPASPSSKAILDAAAAANPNFAAAVAAFSSMPNLRMAVQQLLGNAFVVIPLPSSGLPLTTIGAGLSAQFQSLLGTTAKVEATKVTQPIGEGLHWALSLSSRSVTGTTVQLDLSVYAFANATTTLLVELVAPRGGPVPDEAAIIGSLRFVP